MSVNPFDEAFRDLWRSLRQAAEGMHAFARAMAKAQRKAARRHRKYLRKRKARDHKSARILARQIARSEHHIRARPLLHRGKAWR